MREGGEGKGGKGRVREGRGQLERREKKGQAGRRRAMEQKVKGGSLWVP